VTRLDRIREELHFLRGAFVVLLIVTSALVAYSQYAGLPHPSVVVLLGAASIGAMGLLAVFVRVVHLLRALDE